MSEASATLLHPVLAPLNHNSLNNTNLKKLIANAKLHTQIYSLLSIADHGSPCRLASDCSDPEAVCSERRCRCPVNMAVDVSVGWCRILPSETCSNSRMCYTYSTCSNSTCECITGYAERDSICQGQNNGKESLMKESSDVFISCLHLSTEGV